MARGYSVIWWKPGNGPNPRYHYFPKDDNRRKDWIMVCAQSAGWEPRPCFAVCSKHFNSAAYFMKGVLKTSSVPSVTGKFKICFRSKSHLIF